MKNFGLILLCTLSLSVHGLAEWRRIFEVEKLPELQNIPIVTWTLEGSEIVVKIANQLNEELLYGGYDSARPQLFFEELRDGHWVDTTWHFCGTGMETYKLAPKGEKYFRIAKSDIKPPMRVYTSFFTPDLMRRSLVLIYSSEKPQSSK